MMTMRSLFNNLTVMIIFLLVMVVASMRHDGSGNNGNIAAPFAVKAKQAMTILPNHHHQLEQGQQQRQEQRRPRRRRRRRLKDGEKKLRLAMGEPTILAVRLSTTFREEPAESLEDIRSAIFGDGGGGGGDAASSTTTTSVVDQFAAMSHGQVRFRPATTTTGRRPGIIQRGVAQVTMDRRLLGEDIRGGDVRSSILNATRQAVLTTTGGDGSSSGSSSTSLEDVADYVVFCLPTGAQLEGSTEYLAFTSYPSPYSYYNQRCTKLSFVIHEIGHALGMKHSGFGSNEYADTSGYMGFSEDIVGAPRKAFNAHKHWLTGWFRSRQASLDPGLPHGALRGRVVSFVDFGRADLAHGDVVLIRVGDLYLQYNKAKGYNSDTPRPFRDTVTLVQAAAAATSNSVLVAMLTTGRSYTHTPMVAPDGASNATTAQQLGVTITVCEMNTTPDGIDFVTISLHLDDGIQQSQCESPDPPAAEPPQQGLNVSTNVPPPSTTDRVDLNGTTTAPREGVAPEDPRASRRPSPRPVESTPTHPPTSAPTRPRRIVSPPQPAPMTRHWSPPIAGIGARDYGSQQGTPNNETGGNPGLKATSNLRGNTTAHEPSDVRPGMIIIGTLLGLIGLTVAFLLLLIIRARRGDGLKKHAQIASVSKLQNKKGKQDSETFTEHDLTEEYAVDDDNNNLDDVPVVAAAETGEHASHADSGGKIAVRPEHQSTEPELDACNVPSNCKAALDDSMGWEEDERTASCRTRSSDEWSDREQSSRQDRTGQSLCLTRRRRDDQDTETILVFDHEAPLWNESTRKTQTGASDVLHKENQPVKESSELKTNTDEGTVAFEKKTTKKKQSKKKKKKKRRESSRSETPSWRNNPEYVAMFNQRVALEQSSVAAERSP